MVGNLNYSWHGRQDSELIKKNFFAFIKVEQMITNNKDQNNLKWRRRAKERKRKRRVEEERQTNLNQKTLIKAREWEPRKRAKKKTAGLLNKGNGQMKTLSLN